MKKLCYKNLAGVLWVLNHDMERILRAVPRHPTHWWRCRAPVGLCLCWCLKTVEKDVADLKKLYFMSMDEPSFNRSPSAFVFFCRSDPAKSTRWNFDRTKSWLSLLFVLSMWTVKMACDRLLSLFMAVDAVVRMLAPSVRHFNISCGDATVRSVKPTSYTKTPIVYNFKEAGK